MRRTMPLFLGVGFALSVGHSLAAQTLPVSQGARVRVVTTKPSKSVIGVVDSVSEGTIRIRMSRYEGATLRVDQLSRVDVSRLQKRPTWSKTAPLWLTAVSGALGAVLGYATTPKDDLLGPEMGAAAGGALGGILGLIVGTGLAIGVQEETWEPVFTAGSKPRASGAAAMYVAPRPQGVALGLRATF